MSLALIQTIPAVIHTHDKSDRTADAGLTNAELTNAELTNVELTNVELTEAGLKRNSPLDKQINGQITRQKDKRTDHLAHKNQTFPLINILPKED